MKQLSCLDIFLKRAGGVFLCSVANKKNRGARVFLAILSLIYTPLVYGITPEQVVLSSLEHFPKVIESVRELEIKSNQLDQARGAFDGKVKGSVDARADGFYDGDIYKLSVEKPIPYFNSKFFGGRRQGFGSFPSYEGKSETLSDGEDFVGFSVSLLRDSLIDTNRYNIRYREQDRNQAQWNLDQVKLNVQNMALKSYWTWFVKGHELQVYQSMLNLATQRAKNLNKRIKAGDLARIYGTENNQYILKRKAEVAQKNLEFQEARFYLSLFYRGRDGRPQEVSIEDLPALEKQTLQGVGDFDRIFQKAIQGSLELKILGSKQKQAELDVRMGNNDLLPGLDLKYEWSQDRGVGSSTLSQEENRIMLSLEVPFQYRKGLGKKRAGKAKLEQVKVKKQFLVEKGRTQVQALMTKLNAFVEIFNITQGQIQLSDSLAQAERKKFARGASDLILVNIREENLAEAQIKNLETLLKYHFIDADLRSLQVEFIR